MNDNQAQIFRALDALLSHDDRWRVVPSPGCVTVTRGWPDGSADTVIILSPETAYAAREDPQGRQAWSVRGTADQIVAAVHELPSPHRPPSIVERGQPWPAPR